MNVAKPTAEMSASRIREHLEHIVNSLEPTLEDVSALGHLVARLEQLGHAVPHGGDTWKPRFRDHWGVLEQVYAVALDRSSRELGTDARSAVREACADLEVVVAEGLDSLSS